MGNTDVFYSSTHVTFVLSGATPESSGLRV